MRDYTFSNILLKDAFDILRNVPPPQGFDVSKVLLSTTTPAPTYHYPSQITPEEYQALMTARSNNPLTTQQRIVLYNLQQKINAQKQYSQTHSNSYNPYLQRAAQGWF